MSEPTSNNTPTDQPVSLRKLRHSIQRHAYFAAVATAGQPGLSKADQMIRADKCIEELETALAKAKAARDLVASRDFDAHQAEKAVKQVTHDALPAGEAAQEKLTFQQIIEQLEGKAPGTDKPGDTPPF
jgi:small-conductance mechanosensitive channel